MGKNVTLMIDWDVPGVLHRYVEGYDLIRGKTTAKLGRIPKGLGVRSIHEFDRFPPMDHLPEEARVAMKFGYWDEESWGPNPSDREPLWHDSAEVLATLRAIRSGIDELEAMEWALTAATEAGVRFHGYFEV